MAARGAGRRIAVDAGRLNNATASDRATWALTQGTTASVQYKSHQKALSLGPPTTVGWLAGRLSRTLVARVGAPPDCTGSFIMWRCGLSRVRWQLAGGSRQTSYAEDPRPSSASFRSSSKWPPIYVRLVLAEGCLRKGTEHRMVTPRCGAHVQWPWSVGN